MYYLAPSILAADFADLGNQVQAVTEAGAKYIHIDVMDGEFVPSISFGMPIIKSIRGITDCVFDVHLMVNNPERYIADFVQCGADIITVHAESCIHLDRTLSMIRECGVKAGVALNPSTSLCMIENVFDKVDMVLLMSVNPGFGGQKYIPYITKKIFELKHLIKEKGYNIDIEVDGGINKHTINEVIKAGANVIVAGSAVYSGNIKENTKELLKMISEFEKEKL